MIKCVYPQLVAEMYAHGLTLKQVSEVIGKSYDSTRRKLNGSTPFFIDEAMAISENLFPDVDFKILFSKIPRIPSA